MQGSAPSFGMPPRRNQPTDGIPKPKSIKELPSYISKTVKGFCSRLFYIISLVWETKPIFLMILVLFCILNGVLPIIGAYISSEILNAIAELLKINPQQMDSVRDNVFIIMLPVVNLITFDFIYRFSRRVIDRASAGVTSIAGELVVNNIKLKIINKSKTVDMASFDNPAFYEKLENANREAGMRPLGILTATLSVISSAISVVSFIIIIGTLSIWAPIIIIVSALPGAIVNYYYRNRNFLYMRRHSKDRREMN